MLRDLQESFGYVRKEPTIWAILLFTLVVVLLSMPYQMMMPIFADDILKVGATGMGVLMSMSGIGAMAGALALASVPSRRRGLLMIISGLVLGVALVGFSFSRVLPLALVLMVFIGIGQSGRQTLGSTLLQSYSHPDYLGRVMSFNMMDMGLSSLGTFFAGILAENIGAQWSIGGFAILLVILSILALGFLPRIRKLE